MNAKEIAGLLAADGWELSYTVKDPGGWERESVFEVTLTRNGRTYATEYTKGCAHRVWKRGNQFPRTNYWDARRKPGQSVELFGLPKLKPGDVTAEFDRLTEAEPPTVDEVLWSLVSDASGVRHGQTFDEWAGEYGYDTDSRKAEKAFNSCRDEWAGLIRLGADFGKLDELFQDY